ncbi:hybrid non-ribosomal peptide synthetase/type I polyketide synthase [Neotamlana nanhaiensis]|uniref:hybrid non-ribosomal peptide synthetase/type I polyketide synthase n=1 Tax=Neotamlana nanhaiensis TaxID=1382798 RepID=UPI00069A8E52|nr:hybrid non-ribosomal peptide synthetase/type I polyketide synthase [Tamlana nanhaiensis]
MGGNDASRAYNISYSLKLGGGELNDFALNQSLNTIVLRHESMRACFSDDGNFMTIFKNISFETTTHDLSNFDKVEKENQQDLLIKNDANFIFNLTHGPLFKFSLIKLSTEEHVLITTFHHAISDGLSVDQFFKELAVCYNAYSINELPPLNQALSYSEFAKRENEVNHNDEQYWLNLYKDFVPNIELPLDFERPQIRTYNNNVYNYKLNSTLFNDLKQLGVKAGSSLVVTFMSAFELFLKQIIQQNDLVIGLNTSRHIYHDMAGLIGHGVNLLPIKSVIDDNLNFNQYLKIRKTEILDAFEHQSVSFGQLLQKLPITTNISKVPLVPFVLNIEFNNNLQNLFSFNGLNHEIILNHRDFATFEIEIQALMNNDGPNLIVNYNTTLFKLDTIKNLLEEFENILKRLVENPLQPINKLISNNLIDPYNKLNNTKVDFPQKCLHNLIFEQSQNTPNHLALEFNEVKLTYKELFEQATKFAHFLQSKSVKKGDLIAVSLNRSPELVPILIAILQCGAAYVPLDPKFPQSRLEFMIEDSEAKFLITNKNIDASFSKNTEKLLIEEILEDCKNAPTTPVTSPVSKNDLAYVLYTSGSTGKPKGVKVTHKNLVNFLNSMAKRPGITTKDRVLSITTISFDIAGLELFLPLTQGATLVLTNDTIASDGWKLLNLIKTKSITYLQATPTTWQMLIDSDWTTPLPIKALCGGEPMPLNLAKQLTEKCIELWNMYGPTETTIWSTIKKVEKNANNITIGKPIDNTRIYILNEQNNLVKSGEIGEICIAGDGVSNGYLKRPDLTSSKFFTANITENLPELIYKTGDLGKLLPHGEILCLGRADNQVKLRGHRIELGEIESTLNALSNIKQSAVVINNSGIEPKIVAYLTSKNNFQDTKAVKQSLRSILPEILVPKTYMWLKEFPQTPNGKIDKKQLPEPVLQRATANQVIKKPNTELEKELSDVWSEFLGLDTIGLEENFFEIGGSSILAQKVISELRKKLKTDIPLIKLFQFPTIAQFSEYLKLDTNANNEFSLKEETQSNSNKDIAIIGVSGRFPGAETLEEFWEILKNGEESISFFSDEDLDISIPNQEKDKANYVKARGILKDAKSFDANFFGLNPMVAKTMDPQQRIFLEIAYEALEQSGQLTNKNNIVGVYAGCDNTSYHTNNILSNSDIVNQVGSYQVYITNSKDFIAPRVAYHLNLKGPAVSVHSACSTALLAVAEGVKAIRAGQCNVALAGASSISAPIKRGHLYEEGSIFSPDGHCRSFDAKGQGTIFSDGAGVFVLKSLEEAEKDGDFIYAVIKGIGINNDGANKGSFTAPSSEGQAGAIMNALNDAQVLPNSIEYVEAHGTATPIGDPIEVEGLKMAYGKQKNLQYCAIGSVKSNIGHTGAAAGAAGLIKTLLALKNKKIPPIVGFNNPNPNIDFENSPFFVNNKLIDWSTNNIRRAGISSFGVGGTNVHIILDEYTMPEPHTNTTNPYQILKWSAKSEFSLNNYQNKLNSYLNSLSTNNLENISYTLNTTRHNYKHRGFIVINNNDVETDLTTYNFDTAKTSNLNNIPKEVGFLFPGQGSQFLYMGKVLYENEEVYRHAIDTCSEILKQHLNLDIRTIIFPESDTQNNHDLLKNTLYTQPALFITEYALAKLWMSWGITPSLFCGHSIGELVAAHLSGIFNLEDALFIISKRGQLISELEQGSMMSIRLSEQELSSLLPKNLSIAAVNAKQMCVVSGRINDIEDVAKIAEAKNIPHKLILTSHAFHSSMMEPMLKDFKKAFQNIKLNTPNTPIISTVTGKLLLDTEATDVMYWVNHVKNTVRFADAISTILDMDKFVLLESGPGKSLVSLTHLQAAGIKPITALQSLSIKKHGSEDDTYKTMYNALGELWLHGINPDWDKLYKHAPKKHVSLPNYAFDKQEYWVEPNIPKTTISNSVNLTNEKVNKSKVNLNGNVNNTNSKENSALKTKLTTLISEVSGIQYDQDISTLSFLQLGLESLSLTQLASKLRDEFNIEISFRKLTEELLNLNQLAKFISENNNNPNHTNNGTSIQLNINKFSIKPSNAPSKDAKLGRDKIGNPAWFVPDNNNQGNFIKINF